MIIIYLMLFVAACPAPPQLVNGNSTTTGGSPSTAGDTATYTCDPGYELIGDRVLTCQVNVWFPATPGVCQGACLVLLCQYTTPIFVTDTTHSVHSTGNNVHAQ